MAASGSYSHLIEQLHGLEPPVFVFGGFAEDAVLHGRVTRPHGDIDVLVVRDELELDLEQFRTMGFPAFQTYYEIAGDPIVLGSELNGMNLELCVFERSPGGRLSCRLRAADGVVCRITLAAEAFDDHAYLLDGAPIRVVSPLGLYQIRAAAHHISAFGDFRITDAPAQRELKAQYLADRSEEDLLPAIERLAD